MNRKTVPDSWSSNTEASSAELYPAGWRGKHVTAMGRTEVCLTGGVDHCGADVFEVGWTDATDAIKCGSRSLGLNHFWSPAASGEHHAGMVKYGHVCSHQQPGGQQRSAASGADE